MLKKIYFHKLFPRFFYKKPDGGLAHTFILGLYDDTKKDCGDLGHSQSS